MATNNVFALVRDGLKNALTGRGTSIDKSQHGFWMHTPMGHEQIQAAYRASWLIRKIVDLPADDMTREWRTWELKPEQVKKIEAEERRLRIMDEVLLALVYGRLGGGILLVATDGDMGAEAQDGEKLLYVKALPKTVLVLGATDWEIDSPNFGRPSFFTLQGARSKDELHASRVAVFHGERNPGLTGLWSDDAFWGDSVVEVVDRAVKNVDSTTDGFAGLVDEAKIDVYKLAGMADTLLQPDGDSKLAQRVEATNLGKSNYRGVYLDGDDDWQQKQINWSGMPDLINAMLMVAAGAADIPATRLYGKAPDGQNSTGESDDRNYRSMILTKQNRVLRPALELVDRFLLPAVQVEADASWNFAPLSTPTEKEQADIDKIRADTAKVWDTTGLIPREAFALGVQSMLAEQGTYPSLADEIAKLPEADRIPDPEENVIDPSKLIAGGEPSGFGGRGVPAVKPQLRLASTKDAAPRTLYVSRPVLNATEIVAWAKGQGFAEVMPADELHVTIMCSRSLVDWMDVETSWGEDEQGNLTIPAGGARLVEPIGDKGAVALLFNSSQLSWRHETIKQAGAQHSFPDYQPHVTITWTATDGLELSSVEPYRGAIKLGPEIFEEVKPEGWTPAAARAMDAAPAPAPIINVNVPAAAAPKGERVTVTRYTDDGRIAEFTKTPLED